MSDTTRDREKQESEIIKLYFDLEQASLPDTESSNSENISDSDIPGFTPIIGRKEDPHIKWLTEAGGEENAAGGEGPFVFPHSPAVFMGAADQAAEQPVEEAEAAPLWLQGQPSFAYGLQFHQAGAIPQGQFPCTWENPNWAYNPPMYTQGQPNWDYGLQMQRFEATPSGLPIYTQQQSLAYDPQIRMAEAALQERFSYAPRYPDLTYRFQNQTSRYVI